MSPASESLAQQEHELFRGQLLYILLVTGSLEGVEKATMTVARGMDSRMPAEQWLHDDVNPTAGLRLEAHSEFIGEESGRKLAFAGGKERTAVPALSTYSH